MGGCATRLFSRTPMASSVRWAAIMMIALSGALFTCAGLGRPSSLMCALTALASLWTSEHSQGMRRSGRIGATVAIALLLHRSGLLLIPVWIQCLRTQWTRPAPRPWLSWALSQAATLLPIAALVIAGPMMMRVITATDLPLHILGVSAAGLPSPLAPSTWAMRAWDLGQLAMLLCPAVFLLSAPVPAQDAPPGRLIDRGAALALVLPWCAAAILIRPQQGIFRDLDVFACGALALSVLTACRFVEWSSRSKQPARLAYSALALQIIGVVPLLVCFHLPASGIARTHAYVEGPPLRAEGERFHSLDFLAARTFLDKDWPLALKYSTEASLLAPSPRLLLMRGIAEVSTGDDAAAERTFRTVALRSPLEQSAWLGLYGVAHRRKDTSMADSTTTHLERTSDGRLAGAALVAFRHFPQLVRGVAAR
jgi:hypothetical protein